MDVHLQKPLTHCLHNLSRRLICIFLCGDCWYIARFLSVCLYTCLCFTVSVSLCLYVCLCKPFSLCVSHSLYLSSCLYVYLLLCLSHYICIFLGHSHFLSLFLSRSPSVSVYLSVCLSVCPCLSPSPLLFSHLQVCCLTTLKLDVKFWIFSTMWTFWGQKST